MNVERIDLQTGEYFIPKRINQKFACPENRIKYYNEKANDLRQHLSKFNKPLLKNFRILSDIGEGVFDKEFMLGKGFSFGLFTHYEEYDKINYPCIYNFRIDILENGKLKIIIRR